MEGSEIFQEFRKRRWDQVFPSSDDSAEIRGLKRQHLINALEVKKAQLKHIEVKIDQPKPSKVENSLNPQRKRSLVAARLLSTHEEFQTPPTQRLPGIKDPSSGHSIPETTAHHQNDHHKDTKKAAVTAQGIDMSAGGTTNPTKTSDTLLHTITTKLTQSPADAIEDDDNNLTTTRPPENSPQPQHEDIPWRQVVRPEQQQQQQAIKTSRLKSTSIAQHVPRLQASGTTATRSTSSQTEGILPVFKVKKRNDRGTSKADQPKGTLDCHHDSTINKENNGNGSSILETPYHTTKALKKYGTAAAGTLGTAHAGTNTHVATNELMAAVMDTPREPRPALSSLPAPNGNATGAAMHVLADIPETIPATPAGIFTDSILQTPIDDKTIHKLHRDATNSAFYKMVVVGSCSEDSVIKHHAASLNPEPYLQPIHGGVVLSHDMHENLIKGIFSPFTEFVEELRREAHHEQHASHGQISHHTINKAIHGGSDEAMRPLQIEASGGSLLDDESQETDNICKRKNDITIPETCPSISQGQKHSNSTGNIGEMNATEQQQQQQEDAQERPLPAGAVQNFPSGVATTVTKASSKRRASIASQPPHSGRHLASLLRTHEKRHHHHRHHHHQQQPSASSSSIRASLRKIRLHSMAATTPIPFPGSNFHKHASNPSLLAPHSSVSKRTKVCPVPEHGNPQSVVLCLPQPVLLSVSSSDGRRVAVVLGSHANYEPTEIVVFEIEHRTNSLPDDDRPCSGDGGSGGLLAGIGKQGAVYGIHSKAAAAAPTSQLLPSGLPVINQDSTMPAMQDGAAVDENDERRREIDQAIVNRSSSITRMENPKLDTTIIGTQEHAKPVIRIPPPPTTTTTTITRTRRIAPFAIQIIASIAVQRSQYAVDENIPLTSSSLAMTTTAKGDPILLLSAFYELPDGPVPSGCPAVHAVPCMERDSSGHVSVSSALAIEHDVPFFAVHVLDSRTVLVSGDGPGIAVIEFDAVWRSYTWGRKFPPAQFHALDLIDICHLNTIDSGGDDKRKKGRKIIGLSSDGLVALWDVTARTLDTATAHAMYAVHEMIPVPCNEDDVHFFIGRVQHRETHEMHAVPIVLSSRTAVAIGTPLFLPHGSIITALALINNMNTTGDFKDDDALMVVLGTSQGTVHCWNLHTGKSAWKTPLNVGDGSAITSITVMQMGDMCHSTDKKKGDHAGRKNVMVVITSLHGDCAFLTADEMNNVRLN